MSVARCGVRTEGRRVANTGCHGGDDVLRDPKAMSKRAEDFFLCWAGAGRAGDALFAALLVLFNQRGGDLLPRFSTRGGMRMRGGGGVVLYVHSFGRSTLYARVYYQHTIGATRPLLFIILVQTGS